MVPPGKPRTAPLCDFSSHAQSRNERVADGEVAVLYAGGHVPLPASHTDIAHAAILCSPQQRRREQSS